MFDRIAPETPDAILHLMQAFRADPRPDKIDLGIGVFRDATGATPVMAAVRQAEARLLGTEATKTYTTFAGTAEFGQAMARLVLGDALAPDRLAVVATPGGTGALRSAFDLVRGVAPGATVWLPAQGWPNHAAMLRHLGMPVRSYAHAAADGTLDWGGMMADLAQAAAGDVLLLHGCCHNPTGIDPDAAQWAALGDLCAARGPLPLVDLAYQGFGDGIDADAAGLRHLARTCPELLVAVSGSKSFGVYRDRVGALVGLADGPAAARLLQGRLIALNRLSISFPPDHGARVVQTVLDDPGLRALWAAELDAMRTRIASLRVGLAAALAASPAPGPTPEPKLGPKLGTGATTRTDGPGAPDHIASPDGSGHRSTPVAPNPTALAHTVARSDGMDAVGPSPAPDVPARASGRPHAPDAPHRHPDRADRVTPTPASATDPRFAAIARQRGMFACLPLSPDQMDRLRIHHGVYATRDGRINIAGLTEATIPLLAARIAAVL